MGGDLVLLSGEEGLDVEQALREAGGWINEIFEVIQPWSPCQVPICRFVWVRCEGIPLHLWKKEFFEKLVSKVGVLVEIDEGTRSFARLDMARLKTRTFEKDPIFRFNRLRVNQTVYGYRLHEELIPAEEIRWLGEGQSEEAEGDDEDDYSGHSFAGDEDAGSSDSGAFGDGVLKGGGVGDGGHEKVHVSGELNCDEVFQNVGGFDGSPLLHNDDKAAEQLEGGSLEL